MDVAIVCNGVFRHSCKLQVIMIHIPTEKGVEVSVNYYC